MPVSQQETERFTVFIPPGISTEIRVAAARRRTTISAVVTEALEQYLQTQAAGGKKEAAA